MDVQGIRNIVMDRVEGQGWTLDPHKDLCKLAEEVGELSREIRRYEEGRERPDEDRGTDEEIRKEIASEIGDILFPLVKIAEYYEITLEEAINIHQSKMTKRYGK